MNRVHLIGRPMTDAKGEIKTIESYNVFLTL